MRRACAILLACVTVASAARAQAQTPAQLEQAKALFTAGAAAYEKHDYTGAIRAFEGANQIAPRPAIAFSLAQAHRRQFYVDGNNAHQKTAIELFRAYVKDMPSGGRHEDAMRALQELGALSPQQDVANVSINASGTPGAHVSIDGAPLAEVPLIGPVSAGKHNVTISADGFVTETREITAVNGQIVPLDVPLKEKPAVITIAAPSGVTLSIDGRVSTESATRPIELGSGAHVVSLVKNGHEAFSAQVYLARGESRRLDVRMPATRQRSIAIGTLVASAVVVVGAATCAALADAYLQQAQTIDNLGRRGNITEQNRLDYNNALELRRDFLTAAGIGFVGAGVLAAVGVVLYVFDTPSPNAVKMEQHAPKVPEKKTEPDLAIAPILSPNVLGASALVRF